jgi:hypothetical protein
MGRRLIGRCRCFCWRIRAVCRGGSEIIGIFYEFVVAADLEDRLVGRFQPIGQKEI